MLFAVDVYKHDPLSTLWATFCFVFGSQLGLRHPPIGAHAHPGVVVHSIYGFTALHLAAFHGNHRIVRLLIASRAAVNGQDSAGCALPPRHRRDGRASPRRRVPCRGTPQHWAASHGKPDAITELLLCGADGAVKNRKR